MTEEIYQRLPAKDADSIMIAPFPRSITTGSTKRLKGRWAWSWAS